MQSLNEYSFLFEFNVKNFFAFLNKRKVLVISLLLSLLFMYGIKLAHYLYGLDTEVHMANGGFLNWFQLGRFGIALLQTIWRRGTLFNPFSAIFLALLLLYFATLFFCYLIYEFSRRTIDYIWILIFAFVFISGGAWCETIYFVMQVVECVLIVAVVPLMVWLLFFGFGCGKKFAVVLNVLLTFFVTAVYQAVIPLYVGTVFACYILSRESYSEPVDEKVHWTMCIKMLLSLVAALILYFIVNKIVQNGLHIYSSGYLTKTLRGENKNFGGSWNTQIITMGLYIYSLTIGNIPVVANFFAPIMLRYAKDGSDPIVFFTENLSAYANVLYIPALFLFIFFALRNSKKSVLHILCVIGFIISIFIMPALAQFHVRTQFIVPFAAGFMFLYIGKKFYGFGRKIWIVIMVLNCFYSMQLIGNLNYSDKIRFDADKAFSQRIDFALKEFIQKENIPEDTPLYFVGAGEFVRSRNFALGDSVGRSIMKPYGTYSFPDLQQSYYKASFINTLLMDYKIGNDEGVMESCIEYSEQMPSFPDKSCIEYLDGAIVMKLSDAM